MEESMETNMEASPTLMQILEHQQSTSSDSVFKQIKQWKQWKKSGETMAKDNTHENADGKRWKEYFKGLYENTNPDEEAFRLG